MPKDQTGHQTSRADRLSLPLGDQCAVGWDLVPGCLFIIIIIIILMHLFFFSLSLLKKKQGNPGVCRHEIRNGCIFERWVGRCNYSVHEAGGW